MSEYYRKDFKRKSEYKGRGGRGERGDGHGRGRVQQPEKVQQPTILLKTRDTERGASPTALAASVAQPSPSTSAKDNGPAVSYTIQAKPAQVEVPAPPSMRSSRPFLDADTYTLVDNCLEFLSDQTDFLVVGCLGASGVGKSTIMSLLAQPDADITNSEELLFRAENMKDQLAARCLTVGIDVFVTSNRIILLDCQPIQAVDLLPSAGESYGSGEMQSLELATFLFSVCHIVLCVHDYFFDPDFVRFLQTAEMLKPSTSTTIGETMIEYFPHLVFIHNMAEDWEFDAHRIKQIQESYVKAFSHSRLQIQTGFGIANGDVCPMLDSTTCGELVNVFLLPHLSSDDEVYTGHPSFKDLFRHFRNQILSTLRTPISHSLLTEKNWYQYACKIWEGIQKSSFFIEYSKLINTST